MLIKEDSMLFFVYVVGAGDDVSIIDTETNKVVATTTVADAARGVAVSPDGKQVWVTNSTADSVSVISTASNVAIGNVPTPSRTRSR
jgi:YVTN family beta-propeller protein